MIKSRQELKGKFVAGAKPQEADYHDLLDSYLHKQELDEAISRVMELSENSESAWKVDNEIDPDSNRPVANRAVAEALQGLMDAVNNFTSGLRGLVVNGMAITPENDGIVHVDVVSDIAVNGVMQEKNESGAVNIILNGGNAQETGDNDSNTGLRGLVVNETAMTPEGDGMVHIDVVSNISVNGVMQEKNESGAVNIILNEENAQETEVDTSLNIDSLNPVSNQAITAKFNEINKGIVSTGEVRRVSEEENAPFQLVLIKNNGEEILIDFPEIFFGG